MTSRFLPTPRQGFHAVKAASGNNLGLLAAGVAFYAFLAFVPLLAAIVLTYGLIADASTVAGHVEALNAVLPSAAAELITDQLRAVTETDQKRTLLGLIVSIVAALWGASKGVKSIIVALNIVYGIADRRGFIGRTLIALAITGALILTMVAGLGAVSVIGFLESLLPGLPAGVRSLLKLLFWGSATVLTAIVITLVYRFAPHREGPPWHSLIAGAVTATLLWLAATIGFGLYVANFANYNATYGALGAVVVMLMWLYLSAYVLLLGAQVNAVRAAA